jgi:hypothetical protein
VLLKEDEEEEEGGRNGGSDLAISQAGFMGYCWRNGCMMLVFWLNCRIVKK